VVLLTKLEKTLGSGKKASGHLLNGVCSSRYLRPAYLFVFVEEAHGFGTEEVHQNMNVIKVQSINEANFAPFGDLIDFNRAYDYQINKGNCDRYNALATPEAIGTDARTVISLMRARPFVLPLTLTVMERHPFGSQAFIPLSKTPFLVVVADDKDGTPANPRAFMTQPGQGVNYHRNTWHSMLTPIVAETDFLIVDRKGVEPNVEEVSLDQPVVIR